MYLKKIFLFILVTFYASINFVGSVHAITPPCQPNDTRVECVFGEVVAPSPIAAISGSTPGAQISTVLSNIISLIYVVAAIVFVFMILFSGFQWLTSGGEKEKVASARQRLTWAIIGIILLATSFVILNLIGGITGFEFFTGNPDPNRRPPLRI